MRPLATGAEALDLALDAATLHVLLDYLALLDKWNKVFNLTAVRSPREMLSHHLLDSLAVEPHLHGVRIIDVGSGPGLPGIPLAVVSPERRFTLLDSNGKKARFMRQAVIDLGLSNVEVLHERVENYRPEEGFDTVISRAFSAIADFVTLAGPLCRQGGRLLAMKGRYPEEELSALPAGYAVAAVHRLVVPELDAERHLVEITKEASRT
ncbi:MAG TPA: 16S rRNA (guanine(527)-N(7))-methyltransferase RsmG [Thioalkalivibrio sp.]|nr:16S rRNA (guanine(527)-N(7))-methyltransferase RsmG [Thioalkalivibrio sp.]